MRTYEECVQQAARVAAAACLRLERESRWTHDTCPECGWDGDVTVITDTDLGLQGWECPECSYFATTRDLEDW